MRVDDLREALQVIAAEAPPSRNDASTVMRPAARRLWMRSMLAGVVALAVVVSSAAAISHVHRNHPELSISSSSGPSTSVSTTPTPARPALSATTITNGQWSAIAPFPLAARNHDAVVWTGSQMIVWGGDNGQRVFGDGAAYDPNTNAWRVLPPAPIAARTMAASVWTGTQMILWGGDRAVVGNYADDGAAFDPASWKWRRVAAAPLAPRYAAHMLWTGSEVMVVGGSKSNSNASTLLDAAVYDPVTDRWRPIASLPGVHGATIIDLQLLWISGETLAWELSTLTAGTLTTYRLQLVKYDPATGAWRRGPAPDNPHRNVVAPIWTGHEVIAPAVAPLCDLPDGAVNCGPPPTNLHAGAFDPATGTWRPIPHGPADDAANASVWTGEDLVVLSGGANDPVTGATIVRPGTAAAWNALTDVWTALPPAPIVPDVDTALWTGREILIWGTLTAQPGGTLSNHGLRYGLASATARKAGSLCLHGC